MEKLTCQGSEENSGLIEARFKEAPALELNSGNMPHVTGEFASLDDWMDALAAEFGECVDVSPSFMVEGGANKRMPFVGCAK